LIVISSRDNEQAGRTAAAEKFRTSHLIESHTSALMERQQKLLTVNPGRPRVVTTYGCFNRVGQSIAVYIILYIVRARRRWSIVDDNNNFTVHCSAVYLY